MWWKKWYFDKQDRELLTLVNRVINMRAGDRMEHKIFDTNLHPHGIKALAISREMRIARAVVKLLDSLEAGEAEDRLRALRALYDEVLNSAQTSLRRNTARVLIQVMKELVRAHGDERRQLMLAHDFRQAARGTPRIVRRLLDRYHLVEMPEEWSQLSFDHHVHDANTKGRKNPTHLIMDAWIKGIRHLTVIYYNFVEPEAAREILRAADIMGVSVRIGIELSAPFRKRFVHFIWVPRGFPDADGFLEFLAEPPVRHIMELGRAASQWQQRYVFLVLERWNTRHRRIFEQEMDMTVPPLTEEEFRAFVGAGQPSLLHLAECIYRTFRPQVEARAAELRRAWLAARPDSEARRDLELELRALNTLDASAVHDTWLVPEKNPDLPSPDVPTDTPDTPELLRLSPMVLLNWISSLHSGYRITLNLANLTPEEVLELLWNCQGLITHLEIFNLKEWCEGKLSHLAEINRLQQAVNHGSAPRLKRMIRDMIKRREDAGDCAMPENMEHCAQLRAILRNIPTLQGFYKTVPLRSRSGTDSTSRSHKVLGMGLVFPETLTVRGQRYFQREGSRSVDIPVNIEVHRHVSYRPVSPLQRPGLLTRLIRALPGGGRFGYRCREEWVSHSSTARIGPPGNIAPLGGTIAQPHDDPMAEVRREARAARRPPLFYLDTRLSNALKVLAGFLPAAAAFQYTQSWWFLAWFGPLLWFAITGVRNIVQSVVAGGGLHRSTLLRWNDHVSWARLCDSLMYTGFSVVLLEVGIRLWFLQDMLGYTVGDHPVLVYTSLSAANGLYLAAHNIYRGLPREAVVGNLFRSLLAIPVSMLYNECILDGLEAAGVADPLAFIQPGAAIISKTASDSVAALIEGYADYQNNLRMRRWDYDTKLRQMFETYTKLELLFPEDDALELLSRPKQFIRSLEVGKSEIETEIIINALDLMHFWLYQPCAQAVLMDIVHDMSEEERIILARSQLVLVREKEVSQLFVNGLVGRDFARALAFYLDRHEEYLRATMHLCSIKS